MLCQDDDFGMRVETTYVPHVFDIAPDNFQSAHGGSWNLKKVA